MLYLRSTVIPDDGSATRLGSIGIDRPPSSAASAFDEGGFTPGTVLLSRYRIVGLIGRGGMGEVYRAQDLKLGQSVALKFLPESMQRDPARLERFLSEVRVARQISHPNVCRVYDVGEIEGRHFLSMEFVDGEDLASLLRRIGRLPGDKGVEIARQLCAGLAAAHDRGVLHRDLKPANIMIDGRGHARLADFGLAAAVDGQQGGREIAGTPAYMAPEQIEGQELSTKTDIYALGLVLHEIFTGKRVFDGGSIQELRARHRERSSTASSIASSVDLDPAVDRVIRRCLEPDPRNRPPSALAVSAALPGGDPLAAALAAGETPSPELLAESGAVGALSPAVAWALLALVAIGLAATAWLAGQVRFYRLAPGMRSPEVLSVRAEDLLDAVGYGSLRADTAYGWRLHRPVITYVARTDPLADRWERLSAADAPALQFWYRQGPEALVPYDFSGGISLADPPLLEPGMANVVLSPGGRLVSFQTAPLRYEHDATAAAATTDWSPLFAAAGIDPASLRSAPPRWTPPTYADERAAWEGTYPGRSDWMMRVEAAAHRSRPVSFEVMGPWVEPPAPVGSSGGTDLASRVRSIAQPALLAILLVSSVWLARRNLRAGRADTRGAAIVGFATGAPLFVAAIPTAHLAADPGVLWARFTVQLAMAIYWAGMIWVVYLALEPYVRRRWPEALISWTRLLAGRVTDPLVGRDILVGCVGGVLLMLALDLAEAVPAWLGQTPVAPTSGNGALQALGSTGTFALLILLRLTRVLTESLLILFMLLLLLIVLRNRWAAYAVMIGLFLALSFPAEQVLAGVVGIAAMVGIIVLLVSRFGVLAYTAAWFVNYTVSELPFSFDGWFAPRSVITAVLLMTVAGWGFYRSLGGRSPLGAAFD